MPEIEEDCRWLLRENKYTRDNNSEPITLGKSGRIYCMYTCSITKNQPAEKKIKFIDTNACPHLIEIANTCPIIEAARVLEGYYIAHSYKKEI